MLNLRVSFLDQDYLSVRIMVLDKQSDLLVYACIRNMASTISGGGWQCWTGFLAPFGLGWSWQISAWTPGCRRSQASQAVARQTLQRRFSEAKTVCDVRNVDKGDKGIKMCDAGVTPFLLSQEELIALDDFLKARMLDVLRRFWLLF